jgi:hypothetical protein
MHGFRTAVRAGVCALAMMAGLPAAAQAGWPLAGAGRVELAFGANYSAGSGGSAQHRGVDLAAEAGERVLAPLAGTVSFAGSVPGVGGGRVVAVTIETSRGKITLLPLEHASVKRGATLAEGDAVGALAGSGDGSSAGAHVHVGARDGDLYLDPLGLMAVPPPVPGGGGSGAGVSVGVPGAAAAGAGASAGAGAGIASGVSLAPRAGSVSANPAGARVPVVAGELAPGVSVAVRGGAQGGAGAAAPRVGTAAPSSSGLAAAGAVPQATRLTADGVVVAAGTAQAPGKPAAAMWLSGLIARMQGYVERSVRIASFVLLGVMAALGALWPLWRSRGKKGPGKVLVSTVGEDVAAVPSR